MTRKCCKKAEEGKSATKIEDKLALEACALSQNG